jgi:hypothetical protein
LDATTAGRRHGPTLAHPHAFFENALAGRSSEVQSGTFAAAFPAITPSDVNAALRVDGVENNRPHIQCGTRSIQVCTRNLCEEGRSTLLAAVVKSEIGEGLSLGSGRGMADKVAKDCLGKVNSAGGWLRRERLSNLKHRTSASHRDRPRTIQALR